MRLLIRPLKAQRTTADIAQDRAALDPEAVRHPRGDVLKPNDYQAEPANQAGRHFVAERTYFCGHRDHGSGLDDRSDGDALGVEAGDRDVRESGREVAPDWDG